MDSKWYFGTFMMWATATSELSTFICYEGVPSVWRAYTGNMRIVIIKGIMGAVNELNELVTR